MAEMIGDCPRCYLKHTTLSILAMNQNGRSEKSELFCVCRNCARSVIFEASVNPYVNEVIHGRGSGNVTAYLSEISVVCIKPEEVFISPEFVPEEIETNFNEGAQCYSIGCYNAAATMFRLCLDKATKSFLPADLTTPPAKIRRSLGLRMEWLFANQHLPTGLEDLAECIKDDGNDGAHDGILSKADVDDLIDFTIALLERLYTEPKKLELAKQRRIDRRLQQ